MPKSSISEMLVTSPLLRPSERAHAINATPDMKVFRSDDMLAGKVGLAQRSSFDGRSGGLGKALSKLLAERRRPSSVRAARAKAAPAQDKRQRVVVTVFYHQHGGGAAAGKLIAHSKYLTRDGAGPDGEPGAFYDHEKDQVEPGGRFTEWADDDKRHIRLMLAPESGARIHDLRDFTRATMAQMERDIGAKLEWIAVDHHNTDNPHVHVLLRGRRRDGADLVIERDYASWGLRGAARDVATQMLGNRGPEDDRLSLDRETRAERTTRLDKMLADEVRLDRAERIQAIGRAYEPVLRAALRNRVRELARMGLAQEEKPDRFRFDPDWVERLEGIGKGIDLMRRLGKEVAPGDGRLKLYEPTMGRIAGPVIEAGRRGEKGKAYVIVRDVYKRPVLANVRQREIDGLEAGSIVAVEPKEHSGRGARVSLEQLSTMPIGSQVDARAETELDREIVRALAGEKALLPTSRELRTAVNERIAWHQREGHGGRDLLGRFGFEGGVLERLRSEELGRAETDLSKLTGKSPLNAADGLEREWRVRGFVQLHQGRFAQLERSDAVALIRVTRSLSLKQGKAYSLSAAAGKVKATPSLGLDR
jgi:type IV secretory pathway VirD2 relaxase